MSQAQFAQQPVAPPPPPHMQRTQQPQRPGVRPRSKSGFSFRSHKSEDSFGSGGQKLDLQETPREKAARRLSSKADPRLAMSEAEPSAVASDHSSRLSSLRAIQHRDMHGLPIAEPDQSNPTRSRWERPLDTIRSFEAAIDGSYARKSGRYGDAPPDSRRSSYAAAPRNYQGNGYGGRGQPYRNDSYNGNGPRPDSYYYDNNQQGNGYFPNRSRYPRNGSDQALNNMAGVYPRNGNAQSYETVTTAAGSGSSGEPLEYTTDPSSDNSSFDRVPSKADYNSPPNGQVNGGNSNGYGYPNGQPAQNGVPLPPVKDRAPPRVPIKLGKAAGGPTHYEPPQPVPDKRKSWFAKRFSKS